MIPLSSVESQVRHLSVCSKLHFLHNDAISCLQTMALMEIVTSPPKIRNVQITVPKSPRGRSTLSFKELPYAKSGFSLTQQNATLCPNPLAYTTCRNLNFDIGTRRLICLKTLWGAGLQMYFLWIPEENAGIQCRATRSVNKGSLVF